LTVTRVIWLAGTFTAAVQRWYPSRSIRTACEPARTCGNSRGVCPTCCRSTNTAAPEGVDAIARVPKYSVDGAAAARVAGASTEGGLVAIAVGLAAIAGGLVAIAGGRAALVGFAAMVGGRVAIVGVSGSSGSKFAPDNAGTEMV